MTEQAQPPAFPPRKIYTTNPNGEDTVSTNHFRVGTNVAVLNEYQLIIDTSRQPNKTKSKAIFTAAVETNKQSLKTYLGTFAWDFMSTIIAFNAPQNSPVPTLNLKNVVIGGQSFPTKIRLVCSLDCNKLMQYTKTANPENLKLDLNPYIRACNIVLSNCFHDSATMGRIIKVGANKFYRDSSRQALGPSLETMRGYFYSLKAGNKALLLNANAACSAFYRKQTVAQFLNDNRTFENLTQRYAALRGIRVEIDFGSRTQNARDASTREREENIRTIQSFSNETLENLAFDHEENGKTKMTAYLKEKYGLDTKQPQLFAVNVGTRLNKVWYAPEHLRIVEDQVFRKIVPDNLTDNMMTAACKDPGETKLFINQLVTDFLDVKLCPALALLPDMMKVAARWEPLPVVRYKNEKTFSLSSAKIRWNLEGCQFLRTKGVEMKLRYYVIVCPGLEFKDETIRQYEMRFQAMVGQYRLGSPVRVSPPRGDTLTMQDCNKLEESLNQKLTKAKQAGAQLVILIQNRKSREVYSVFKSLADRSHGLQSICLTERANVGRPKHAKGAPTSLIPEKINQYMGNIMMKTNLKFGGQNHDAVIRLQTAEKGKFKNLSTSEQMQHTLVLGADVTHPSPSSIQYCPSVASVVGSVGCGSGKFLGSMRLQQGKQEIIEALEPMVFERVIDWAKGNHGRIPVNVLYYRDGVDEGQYGKVKNKEVPQITAALRRAAKELKKSPKEISELESNLKITAIVVAKRHHTRFFPQNNQQRESRGGNNNTRPGLIVEHTVTSPYYTDFYLQSHSGLKGTVKPTHYFFLQNDLGWSLANIMTFTQGLCYTYVRSTIGVSYASPTYYADRLCERGRCYLRDLFNGSYHYRIELDALANRLADTYSQGRRKRFGVSGKGKGKGFAFSEKSEREVEEEEVHKKAIRAALEKKTMGWAEEEFYRYREGKKGNPWMDEVGKVMFWM